jgi:hypothetical protein
MKRILKGSAQSRRCLSRQHLDGRFVASAADAKSGISSLNYRENSMFGEGRSGKVLSVANVPAVRQDDRDWPNSSLTFRMQAVPDSVHNRLASSQG